ncbi:MAG: amino acid adenylation domain-containing protein, partial [Lachnospiraceae bacterium]|nr:amino acid adenylation domain-containing protein [Lachnospiraceae bacterium]
MQLCLDEKKRRSSEELPAAKAVYEGIFSGISIDSLPDPEKPYDKNGTGKAAVVKHMLTGLSPKDVTAFCEANKVTENALFTSAFALMLARLGGCDEALFSAVYNGRTRMETMHITGMLVKTYPIYVTCDNAGGTTDFILSVQKRIRELTANDLYSFAEAVRDFDVNADIIFAYQGDSFSEYTLAGQKAEQIDLPFDDAKEPLSVDVWKRDGQYTIVLEYRDDMYTESQIRWMADIYGMLVDGLMNRETLGSIPVLSGKAEAFLNDINDTKVDVPFRPVHCLMEEAAAANPDHPAVITPAARVTYRELNESANRIAHALIDLDAPGRIVGLILPRSEHVYMVRQGILKAGAAFMSMTPDYPDERIRAMMEDSKAAALIATEDIIKERGSFFDSLACPVVSVEKLLQNERTDNPDQSVEKDDLAYCIFTSGSTGRPKGVMLTQANLVNFLDANPKNPEILGYTDRGHVSLALAAITFDVSIMEEFIPLSHGMTICMATEEEIHNPVALAKLMTDAGVDVMTCTPSFLSNCIGLSVMKEAFSNIVSYDMGAEAFPAALFDKIRSVSPNALIMNGYGPTEATVSCTMDPITDPGLITIGRPASNVRAYILDGQGNILPPLLPGELIIAGDGVGRGYVGMSELTAEKFITIDGLRAYRTGDLAAWTSDGRLKFHGRADNQVKLRGLRIELGEVENAINDVPGVLTSIVIMTGKENNQFLAGYYTASRDVSPEEVRDEIKKTLASYMVPGVLTKLEEMPLTANGKIDKKKLPKVENTPEHTEYETPANETEELFCRLFEEVLGIDTVGATDDFFACGGTSLSATSIMIRANEENYSLTYGDVFKYKTPRALAAQFSKMEEGSELSSSGTSDIFADYDYTAINELLSKNTIESFNSTTSRPIGNILLTGATGYMGIHVLEEFLKNETGKAWCFVRKGKYKSAFERLK